MRKRNIRLSFVSAIASIALMTTTCRLPTVDFLQSKTIGLQHIERAKDGQVSGSFVYPQDQGNETVQFSVSANGLAGFWIEGASEDNILTVDIQQEESSLMSWGGEQLDGFGALRPEEKAALDDLMFSDLAFGLAMIPLDIACQDDGLVDPHQVAALLYPLQMRFKYLETDRTATASLLGSLSQCTYGDDETDANQNTSMIIMMPSSPVPVVFGHFPFDPEGAAEVATATSSDVKLVSLNTSFLFTKIEKPSNLILPGNVLLGPEPIRDEWGPCKSKCRGACGSDCTTSNCILTVEDRCEKNQDGENDGFKSIVYVYDCGLHPSCIEHDACYDTCNSYYGCDTWSAAFCMHAESFVSAPFEFFSDSYLSCDSEVWVQEGLPNALAWMQGSGTQPTRQVFEYTDPDYSYDYDPVSCPLGETTGDEEPATQPEKDQESSNPEEDYTIPAGTYTGETTFYTSFDGGGDYSNPVCNVNTIRLIIRDDGTAQGEVRSICTYNKIYGAGEENFGNAYHSEVTGVIQGTLLESTDQLSISYTWRTYFTSNQWETTSIDKTVEFAMPYHVNVVDDLMNLNVAADIEAFYSFILTKE